MVTEIFKLPPAGELDSPVHHLVSKLRSEGTYTVYTLSPKQALIAYMEQIRGNYSTWDYPDEIKGIEQLGVWGLGYRYESEDYTLIAIPAPDHEKRTIVNPDDSEQYDGKSFVVSLNNYSPFDYLAFAACEQDALDIVVDWLEGEGATGDFLDELEIKEHESNGLELITAGNHCHQLLPEHTHVRLYTEGGEP